MYLTVKETAEYLSVSEEYIEQLIKEKKVRALFDGAQYLLFKDQFHTHLQQMEKYKKFVEEILDEPIPDDIDVKDED
ncbi:excisionase family DNA-binding protein [Bacillus suaedaesalsae]|uniref:Excisionase family DNA-binding protein n=1 Tax=Bacillus suaedaesalsae TaxID=2810349 RepID=A0ABS2DDM9_9BACI|nr:excisionase family DNA-binding protein [Bacillus suaedaesalsae]MBM6616559.1 excisionase family DNA-binding protein [Bacillus suaedaesalsae]